MFIILETHIYIPKMGAGDETQLIEDSRVTPC